MSVREQITEMVNKSLFLGKETRQFILRTLEQDVSEEKLAKIYESLKQIHDKESSIMKKAIKKDPNLVNKIEGEFTKIKLKQEASAQMTVESMELGDMDDSDEVSDKKVKQQKKRGFFARLFGWK